MTSLARAAIVLPRSESGVLRGAQGDAMAAAIELGVGRGEDGGASTMQTGEANFLLEDREAGFRVVGGAPRGAGEATVFKAEWLIGRGDAKPLLVDETAGGYMNEGVRAGRAGREDGSR